MFLIPQDIWEVRDTQNKGRGIFTKKDIPAGTIIGDYIGILTPASQVKEPSHLFYEFYYNDDVSIIPDRNKVGVHLVNHSCMPNCDSYPYHGHTLIFTLRHIFPDEELSYSYLLEPSNTEKEACHHICHCGTPLCKGTMHTPEAFNIKWDTYVERAHKEYNEVLPVSLGNELPLLDSYPHTLPDDTFYDIFASLTQPAFEIYDTSFNAQKVRRALRDTGRCITIKPLNISVCAFMNNLVICRN